MNKNDRIDEKLDEKNGVQKRTRTERRDAKRDARYGIVHALWRAFLWPSCITGACRPGVLLRVRGCAWVYYDYMTSMVLFITFNSNGIVG